VIAFVGAILVGVLLVAGVAWFQYASRQARVRAVSAVAQTVGFTFTNADVDRLVDYPFVLFTRRSDKRRVELVISGTHDGVPMRIFDYWYVVQSGRNRTYHRFTCAMATIPAACPRLRLGHENILTRLGGDIGLSDTTMGDVELEYDDFNRRFRVKCSDRKFAFSILDGRMMQWLLDSDDFESVEVDGPWVLLARAKLDPSHWLDLGTWLGEFARQIPAVVYSTYPPTDGARP
jgi:hypothetical protein